jgi:hypothetical protein
MSALDWKPFLTQWSRAWIESGAYTNYNQVFSPEVLASGWLGYPGATEAQLMGAESRLEIRLPPSYRSFLRTTNGWRMTSPFIYKLWSTEDIDWQGAKHLDWSWRDAPEEVSPSDSPPRGDGDPWEFYASDAQRWGALEISDLGDSAYYLLNPRRVNSDGEWEAWFSATWIPGEHSYPSFRALMEAEYERMRELTAR